MEDAMKEIILKDIIDCCAAPRNLRTTGNKQGNGMNYKLLNILLKNYQITKAQFIEVVIYGVNKRQLFYNGSWDVNGFDPYLLLSKVSP